MPRIPDAILESVIYLYESVPEAEAGSKWGGTGFLLGVPLRNHRWADQAEHWYVPSWEFVGERSAWAGPHFLYAVTAAHVAFGGATVARLSIKGEKDILDLPPDAWVGHPAGDDVTILPNRNDRTTCWRVLHPSGFHASQERARSTHGLVREMKRSLPADSSGSTGKQRNRPTVRFGNVAMMPEDVWHEAAQRYQESFLVEMRSLPGYSGSPVFVYESQIELKEKRGLYSHKYYDENPWRHRPSRGGADRSSVRADVSGVAARGRLVSFLR